MLQNNLAQQQGLVSRLTDMQLGQELNNPSGLAPVYMVMGELQKRQQLRQGGIQGNGNPISSVRQEMLNQARGPAQQAPPAQMQLPASVTNQAAQYPQPLNGAGLAPIARMRGGYAAGGPVRHYDMGGGVDTGMGPQPGQLAPVGVPAFTGSFGLPTAQEAGQYMMTAPQQYMHAMGMSTQAPGSLQDYVTKTQSMIPDTSQAYDQPIAAIQKDLDQTRAEGKGTALMKAGLAMMTAPTGNFLTALGVGGMTGLDAMQQARANARAIQGQLSNAQIAAAGAKQQAALHSMDAASAWRAGDQNAFHQNYALAQGAAGQALNAADSAAKLKVQLQDAQIRASAELGAAGAQAGATNARTNADLYLGMNEKGQSAYDRAFSSTYDTLIKSNRPMANPAWTAQNGQPKFIQMSPDIARQQADLAGKQAISSWQAAHSSDPVPWTGGYRPQALAQSAKRGPDFKWDPKTNSMVPNR